MPVSLYTCEFICLLIDRYMYMYMYMLEACVTHNTWLCACVYMYMYMYNYIHVMALPRACSCRHRIFASRRLPSCILLGLRKRSQVNRLCHVFLCCVHGCFGRVLAHSRLSWVASNVGRAALVRWNPTRHVACLWQNLRSQTRTKMRMQGDCVARLPGNWG